MALDAAGVHYVAHPYVHDPSVTDFGAEASAALGVDADRIFKTLVAEAASRLVVGVVPVSASLDLKALAAAVGERSATMADSRVAERRTGYVVGGISPIGQKVAHPTVVDETVELWDTVYVSGGRRGVDVELAPADLVQITGATIAAIARSRF
ncbi:MAG: Cys-tRNA(Pro) deacylase [Acidimicrobiia bacterium]|nr:Cys-tRNA(Pro) deacylase [Acidimicrobiia bacterium]